VFPIPSYFLGFLRVNLHGREPQGIVEPGPDYLRLLERVEADLKRLIDPVSGRPAIRYIARTVDYFDTDPHESLPDIFFDWAPAPYPKRRIEHPRAVLEQKDLFFNRDTRHNLCGFFAAAGPGIAGRGRIPNLSVLDVAPTFLRLMGQPVPESNFVSDENSSVPQHTQWYIPSLFSSTYGPLKARSVPALRVTSYCSGVSCSRHSASVFSVLSMREW